MNNLYIKPLEFDKGGYAVGAFYRYQISQRPNIDTGAYHVNGWPNDRDTSEYIGCCVGGYDGFEEVLKDIANRHNAAQIARFLTPAGRERLDL